MSKKPIAMFPLLLMRSDTTSDEVRPRGEGFMIDREGKPLSDPVRHPEENALEGNPNLMFEKFGEFWRKIHGPRVFELDGPEDDTIAKACTYYQIHRLAGAPSSAFPPPYKPLADEAGRFYPYIWDKIPPYARPAYDGLVYWGAQTVAGVVKTQTSEKAVNKISNEGILFLRNFHGSLSAEYVIKPCKCVPPVCTVKVHFRKKGTQEELQQLLLRKHSQEILAGQLGQRLIQRFAYIFNVNKSPEEPLYSESGVAIDAISVTYFKDMGDCEVYYSSDEYKAIEKKEAELLDMRRSEWWTGIVYPFMYPENEEVTDPDEVIDWT